MSIQTIGLLTSGGDAPGMNAAIRAAVRTARNQGIKVLGIKRGYNGLISGDLEELEVRSVSDIIHRGGTILYTARCLEFKTKEGLETAKKTCEEAGIDGLVVIGGDGTFRGAADLAELGVPCTCIPGTIDNDIACSEYTIGFDTAMNTAMQMVDKLRDTAQSHDRCSIVEVMGRHAGYIALNTGVACGATFIMTPEVPFDFDAMINKINSTQTNGKHHFIIVVAEGVGNIEEITRKIQERTGIDSRATILGHVQRGGSPTVRDRVIASQMASHAVNLLINGKKQRVVAIQQNEIVDFDIKEALAMKKPFEDDLYKIAYEISF